MKPATHRGRKAAPPERLVLQAFQKLDVARVLLRKAAARCRTDASRANINLLECLIVIADQLRVAAGFKRGRWRNR